MPFDASLYFFYTRRGRVFFVALTLSCSFIKLDHFLSGALASFGSCVALQPLDVVKTRLQEAPTVSAAGTRSVVNVTLSIVREEGIGHLWRGTGKRRI